MKRILLHLSIYVLCMNFTVAQTGKVGIGTATPVYKLDVSGNTIVGEGGGNSSLLYLRRQDGHNGAMGLSANVDNSMELFNYSGTQPLSLSSNAGLIKFGNNAGSVSSMTESMRINTTTGYVGIGTTAPSSRLHVQNGTIRAQNNTGGEYSAFYASNTGGGSETRGVVIAPRGAYWSSVISGTYGYAAGINSGLSYVINNQELMNGGDVMKIHFSSANFEIFSGTAYKPGGGSWTATSDQRTKKEISNYAKGLNTLLQINTVTYKYNGKAGIRTGEEEFVGVIAQEVQKVAPSMIKPYMAKMNKEDEEETEILAVDPSEFTYMLINAVKEQNTEIETLKAQVAKLEEENKQMGQDMDVVKAAIENLKASQK